MTTEKRNQTENPAVTAYLSALVDRTTAILGSNLLGVYAAGSLALGSYEHGRSDIDIAIVCAAPLTRQAKTELVEALRHEALPCPARGLELVVYTAAVAQAGTPEPGFEVELNTGRQMDFRVTWAGRDRAEPDGTFWYAIDRSIIAEFGLSLAGPPAADVFRPVPEHELIELLIASLRWHLAQEVAAPVDEPADWTSDAVLNACRAWRRVQAGHWSDKVTAGREVAKDREWGGAADHRAGLRDVVAQALSARTGGPGPQVGQARLFQQRVLIQLKQAAGRAG